MVNQTMKPTTKNYMIVARLTAALLVVGGISGQIAACAQGQDNVDAIVFSSTDIVVTALSNGTSEVSFSSLVTNTGPTAISSFRVRFDVRHLNMTETRVDGVVAMAEVTQADRYMLVTVTPVQAIDNTTPATLNIRFVTSSLQQRIGLSPGGSMYIYHFIYYLRPLNEISNLTMSVIMPSYAILQEDVAAPLFPRPTRNYTDGARSVFVWSTPRLLPGQEIAYIVKYQLPIGVIASTNSEFPVVGVAAVSVVTGAILALVLERTPRLLTRLRRPGPIQIAGISNHEAEVIQFIAQKGGSCTQRDIYAELDLSQSMVSTILTTLEQRGTIRRFKEGRENLVHLME